MGNAGADAVGRGVVVLFVAGCLQSLQSVAQVRGELAGRRGVRLGGLGKKYWAFSLLRGVCCSSDRILVVEGGRCVDFRSGVFSIACLCTASFVHASAGSHVLNRLLCFCFFFEDCDEPSVNQRARARKAKALSARAWKAKVLSATSH